MDIELKKFRCDAAALSEGRSDRKIYDFVKNLISRSEMRGAILDVGAGQGEFLRQLDVIPKFDKKVAVDLQENSFKKGSEVNWIQTDLNDEWRSITARDYEWLVGIEVVEHLENPRHFMRECKRVLRKEGILILTTPNNESYRSLLSLFFRGHFVDFLDSNYPAHLTPVLKKDLERILNENKFEVIEIGYSPWGTLPFFTSLNWETLSLGLLRGKRFGNHLYVMARKTDG